MSGTLTVLDKNGEQQHLRTILPWRSKMLTEVMEILDLLHISSRYTPDGKPGPGNWPRARYPSSTRENKASPPRGLPRNCYDARWLDSLSREAIQVLRPEPEIDLTISERLKQFVFSHLSQSRC